MTTIDELNTPLMNSTAIVESTTPDLKVGPTGTLIGRYE